MRKSVGAGPVAVYLSELSEGSRRTMRFALATAAGVFGGTDPRTFRWHKVRVDPLAALRADLASRLAPNTANKILSAVKGVLRAHRIRHGQHHGVEPALERIAKSETGVRSADLNNIAERNRSL